MITKLKLKNFKSFVDTEIDLGSVTTLVGANASGKSNIRDALRLLHGIGRGYSLAEAIGEKYGEGGFLEWKGIRGGTREMVYHGYNVCELTVEFEVQTLITTYRAKPRKPIQELIHHKGKYSISIELDGAVLPKSRIKAESLFIDNQKRNVRECIFQTQLFDSIESTDPIPKNTIIANCLTLEKQQGELDYSMLEFRNDTPILTQIEHHELIPNKVRWYANVILRELLKMRFLDVSPEEMRKSSVPGHIVLTDRGENLSSVLSTICENEESKELLLEWIREFPQYDVEDLEFHEDLQGKILVSLIESNGRSISASSASDGTLRFLAILAALLSPEPAKLYFFEEIENGIHPSRLHLLVQLMEQRSEAAGIQVMVSTHSPQLLGYLNEKSRETASLVYRTSQSGSSQVQPIMGISHIRDLLEKQNLSDLHASGWFEDVMELMEPEAEESEEA